MILLAMTRLEFWVGAAAFITCIALMLHAVCPWPGNNGERVKVPVWSLVVRFVLECAAFFIWLASALPLLAWGMWIGDNPHWFYDSAWIFAAVIAVAASSIVAVRIAKHGAPPRYLRIHLWVPLCLLLTFAGMVVYDSVRRIEGISAESAAQNVFERLAPQIDQPTRFVEHAPPLPMDLDPARCKSYWILGPVEPRGRFSICRHKWFGWQFANSTVFPPSAQELDRAKKRLSTPADRDGAISILQNIITNYPNTPAQTEARELLKSLDEPAPIL